MDREASGREPFRGSHRAETRSPLRNTNLAAEGQVGRARGAAWAWGLAGVIAAIDVGLALDERVLRSLLSSSDPRAFIRSAVVVGAFALVATARKWRPEPTERHAAPSDHPTPASTADQELVACLAALRPAIANRLAEPVPLALHLGTATVEVFWSGPPADPPPPWTARHPGWIWRAEKLELTTRAERGLIPPATAAFLGAGETPNGSLWLNLEAFQVIALVGDTTEAAQFARTTIRELRRRAHTHLLDLLVVGHGHSDGVDGETDTDDISHVITTMRQRQAVVATQGTTPRRADRRNVGDDLLPLIVAALPTLPAATRGRLAAAARESRGVTCIVVGDVSGADLRLRCRDHTVRVPFLADLPVKAPPTSIHREASRRLDADHGQTQPQNGRATSRGAAVPACPGAALEIQMLGPITVRGAADALTAKSTELVVYLACHPDGIHEDRIKAALWPARAPRPQTWMNRVSATRKALGRSQAGEPWLPRFDRSIGRLAASVVTDVDTLIEAQAKAKEQESADAVSTLVDALKLVRGRPFDAAGYEWAYTERHVGRAERVVVGAAHDLAELTLVTGDWRRALWATDVGFQACPTSELLDHDRIRACAAAGDWGGEPAASDLRRTLVANDSAPAPTSETVELAE